MIVTSQNWRQDRWILEIIKYLRVKNLIVSREAIPSKILVTMEHSNCYITTLQIAAMHSRIVATKNKMQKLIKKFADHLYKCAWIPMTEYFGHKNLLI